MRRQLGPRHAFHKVENTHYVLAHDRPVDRGNLPDIQVTHIVNDLFELVHIQPGQHVEVHVLPYREALGVSAFRHHIGERLGLAELKRTETVTGKTRYRLILIFCCLLRQIV